MNSTHTQILKLLQNDKVELKDISLLIVSKSKVNEYSISCNGDLQNHELLYNLEVFKHNLISDGIHD